MIQDADRPIGTHVFTGMERSDDARDMRWTVVSMPSGHPDGGGEPSSRARGYRDRDAGPTQRGQSDPRPEGSKRGHRGSRKGSGRALVVHLPGMMAGGAADPGGVRDCGFFLLVLDPGLLTSAADYRQHVSAYAETLRTTRPIDPAKPLRVPFERPQPSASVAPRSGPSTLPIECPSPHRAGRSARSRQEFVVCAGISHLGS